jgi:hypothetical protein
MEDGGARDPTARPSPENQETSRPVHVGGNMARGDFCLEKELGDPYIHSGEGNLGKADVGPLFTVLSIAPVCRL